MQIQYSIDKPNVDIVITARGQVYDIHLETSGSELIGIIKTPVNGFERINVAVKKSNVGNEQSLDALVTANDVTKFSLKSSVNLESYAIDLKLKTPFEQLSSLEFNAGVIQVMIEKDAAQRWLWPSKFAADEAVGYGSYICLDLIVDITFF